MIAQSTGLGHEEKQRGKKGIHKQAQTTIPRPLPATAPIPLVGKWFFNAGYGKSYRLAQTGVIVTLVTGPRSKTALVHPTARNVGIDPNNF